MATTIEEIQQLRDGHPAWRLLRADNAPLVIGFLGRVFVDENIRTIEASRLVARLDDELWALNDGASEPPFPRPAKEYLDAWSSDAGWLRKFYPAGQEEPHYDAMPALEVAVTFVRSLAERAFVGTESRLSTVIDLLRQLAFGAESDPQTRLVELRRRRAELDAQIARAEAGEVEVLDDTAVRERYAQVSDTARQLLSDFRQVEQNFRALDRSMREQIAGWNGAKGELLDAVLGERSDIAESDQGRSFQAFHDFLLSSSRQEELDDLLDRVHRLPGVVAERRMRRVHHDWLDAAEQTQSTVRQLSDQLRRFLDDQAWVENRRVMDVLHSIEQHALRLRTHGRVDLSTELDATKPTLVVPFEHLLYEAGRDAGVDSTLQGRPEREVDASALYSQQFVDHRLLIQNLQATLGQRSQVSLGEVVAGHPLGQGLAEVVGYLALDAAGIEQIVDDSVRERLTWGDDRGERDAEIPRIIFARNDAQPAATGRPVPEEGR